MIHQKIPERASCVIFYSTFGTAARPSPGRSVWGLRVAGSPYFCLVRLYLVSIRAGRLESLCRFGSANSIYAGRLESLLRFTTAALTCCVDSGRPTRIEG